MNLRDLTAHRDAFAWRRAERDLDDELAFHIERETGKLVDAGPVGLAFRVTLILGGSRSR